MSLNGLKQSCVQKCNNKFKNIVKHYYIKGHVTFLNLLITVFQGLLGLFVRFRVYRCENPDTSVVKILHPDPMKFNPDPQNLTKVIHTVWTITKKQYYFNSRPNRKYTHLV